MALDVVALDAVVVGAGPNGLAAAITLARAGLSVRLYEQSDVVGGGMRTEALTLPGYRHDVGATVAALANDSPFLRSVDLAAHGVRLRYPPVPAAHPLDGGRAAVLSREVDATAAGLGADAATYRRLVGPLVNAADRLLPELLDSFRRVPTSPRTLATLAGFGIPALLPASVVQHAFRTEEARALFAGIAAHSILPLTRTPSAAYGLVLQVSAHSGGWPVVEGGMGRLAEALVAELVALGGEVVTGRLVTSLAELPPARAVLLDVTPRGLLRIAGDRLPAAYRRRLSRFRYGPGAFKLDYALSGPVPWAAEAVRAAGTVHLGGTFGEIAHAEAEVAAGRHPDRPYVLVVQPSVADPTRAPAGAHALWAYCHVPNGSTVDVSAAIEGQLERFAPGFRDVVLARSVITPQELELRSPNWVGGDINGGSADLLQTLGGPTPRWDPHTTPVPGLYLCSSSTPPGGGVHGMCGQLAARSALRRTFGTG